MAAGCGTAGDSSGPETRSAGAEGAEEESAGRGRSGIGSLAAGWKTDFTKHTVSLDEFTSGGPGKDGIPAIDEPRFESAEDGDRWLEDKEPVIELVVGGEARAYPLQILIWHEIVNDEVAGVPVAVTFCPLCNTALVFDRRIDGRVLDFGTTGNLRNSDLVMYDRETESWWQQFGGEAVVGELAGTKLRLLPARIVSSGDFQDEHPDGQVLSRDTGFDRSYGQNPYVGYDDVDTPPFASVENPDDDRLQPKERVVFIERGGDAVAIPFPILAEAGSLELTVGGTELEIRWQAGARSALDHAAVAAGRDVGSVDVRSRSTGKRVAFDTPFWFAVAAFRPDVEVVRGPS
ncbi:MAG: DUF3179 domain-containing protein [Actinobacteria bacterium]|nr:DUF3179 domain-containing protein [Actinomycetota bacterium]